MKKKKRKYTKRSGTEEQSDKLAAFKSRLRAFMESNKKYSGVLMLVHYIGMGDGGQTTNMTLTNALGCLEIAKKRWLDQLNKD